MIEVVAAVLENDQGQILIAQRGEEQKMGGYWEFPGGKIEVGETPEEALKRELMEEMNVDIKVGNYLGDSTYKYGNVTIKLMVYRGEITGGDIKLNVHQKYCWVKKTELQYYKFPPANQKIIDRLV